MRTQKIFYKVLFAIILPVTIFLFTYSEVKGGLKMTKPEEVGMDSEQLRKLDNVIEEAIKRGDTPGAVVLVARKGKIVYRKAYGRMMVEPKSVPMEIDTIFDLASLTKPIATATSIMLLVQDGKLLLFDKVTTWIPEFGQKGKDKITVFHLLTHTSGLPAWDRYFLREGIDKQGVIADICAKDTAAEPGTKFIYSDLGYIILGELVERISGKPLDKFAQERIFKPLGMKNTMFNPPDKLKPRCAATEKRAGKIIQGEVHDGNAYVLGGVAGHAGLFSTADDLAIFCQMLLNNGKYKNKQLLSPLIVKAMTTNQLSEKFEEKRGLGWGISTIHTTLRGDFFPLGSYGHTGWTGTSILIDPATETFIILLCNRVHPDGKGDVSRLRSLVSNIVATSILR